MGVVKVQYSKTAQKNESWASASIQTMTTLLAYLQFHCGLVALGFKNFYSKLSYLFHFKVKA